MVRALVSPMETGLVVNRRLGILSEGLLDLRLPGPGAEAAGVFAPVVDAVDLGAAPAMTGTPAPAIEVRSSPLAGASQQVGRIDLWRTLLDGVSFLEHARLSIVDGDHPAGNMPRHEAAGRFEALARMKSGEWRFLQARIVREHRCGEGWSVQNSATMAVGIGPRAAVVSVSVRWPSGRVSRTEAVPEGTLLVVHENPADSPTGQEFTRESYRVPRVARPAAAAAGTAAAVTPVFAVHALDPGARPARLRVYTTFATGCQACTADQPVLRRLAEELGAEGVGLVAVPVDEADDDPKLAAYAREWKPVSRLVSLAPARRREAVAAFARALGRAPPMPTTVITEGAGRILASQPGTPNVSALRALIPCRD